MGAYDENWKPENAMREWRRRFGDRHDDIDAEYEDVTEDEIRHAIPGPSQEDTHD